MKPFLLTNFEGYPGVVATISDLESGKTALDSIETGIKIVEADTSIRTVGRGGYPDSLGEMSCDAAVMDGRTLEIGAVGFVRNTLHVVSLARQVMLQLPHVMLTGSGAERFARECNLYGENILTADSKNSHLQWLESKGLDQQYLETEKPLAKHIWPDQKFDIAKGTTIYLGGDLKGNLAGATSTSGWAYKYPGRIGDSPIIGAGLYIDNRYGGCACTHTGEVAIRTSAAKSVVTYMKKGASVKDAVLEVIDDMKSLQGGYIGPVIVHAVSAFGEPYVASFKNVNENYYYFWEDGLKQFEKRYIDTY